MGLFYEKSRNLFAGLFRYQTIKNRKNRKYEPYKPMNMDEVRHNLEWRISTDEMIAVELKTNHKMIENVYLGKRLCKGKLSGFS